MDTYETFIYNDEVLNSNDSMVVKYPNGDVKYYINGELNRVGAPAVIMKDRGKLWYYKDKLHRIDGPSVEQDDGYKAYYLNGNLHRIDGPTVIFPNGSTMYFNHGHLHRIGGPAYDDVCGLQEWWVDGKLIKQYTKNGDKFWYSNDKRHRGYNLPAVENNDGTKEWWVCGVQESKETVDKRRAKDKYTMLLIFQVKLPKYNLVCGPLRDVAKFF